MRSGDESSTEGRLCSYGVNSVADWQKCNEKWLRKNLPTLPREMRFKLLNAANAASCDMVMSYRVTETGLRGDKSVFKIARHVRRRGYRVFVAEGDLEAGNNWPTTIQEAVRNCKAIVAMCSNTYGDKKLSRWTLRELVMADNRDKLILPVWHSGPYPPQGVEIYLSGTQYVPNISNCGYAEAEMSHERVAEQLVKALIQNGVVPSGQPQRSSTTN